VLSPIWQPLPHRLCRLVRIELSWIERPRPFHEVIVLLVVWGSQGFKQAGVEILVEKLRRKAAELEFLGESRWSWLPRTSMMAALSTSPR